jgi:PAS domain S-box-containing protein
MTKKEKISTAQSPDTTNVDKRAEESQLENAEKYQNFLKNINDGCFELDLAGNFTFFNDSACRILGYSKKELMGMNYRQYTDKETAKEVFEAYNKIHKTGEPSKGFNWQVIRKDGVKRDIETSVSLQKDSSGKPTGFIGIVNDITERKSMEKKVRESEKQYRTLVENASDIVFRTDESGHFTFINHVTLRVTGYEESEIIGKHYMMLMRPDMHKKAIKFSSNQLVKKIQNMYYEFPILAKDGHEIWLGQNTQLIMEDGHVSGFQAVARDITEQKKAEQRLQESEKYFKEITENSSDMIIITDKSGKIKYCSRSIERFTGYKAEELIGRIGITLIHPDDVKRALSDYGKVILSMDSAIPNSFRIVHKDGAERYFEGLGKNLLNNPTVEGFIMNIRDITDRKRAEEKLQYTLDSLRKAVSTTIQVMVSAVEMRDPYTYGHQIRSADIARAIATEMGLPEETIDGIRMAGSIHDIGKLSIPAEILSKPTKLTDIEFALIKEHSRSGYEMLKDVESPWPLAEILYQHHERMNGSGYPRNLKGDEIIMESQILAVADVVEAMSSHRPYRAALGVEAALEEINKNKGILYDNTVADACLRLFREKGYQLT